MSHHDEQGGWHSDSQLRMGGDPKRADRPTHVLSFLKAACDYDPGTEAYFAVEHSIPNPLLVSSSL